MRERDVKKEREKREVVSPWKKRKNTFCHRQKILNAHHRPAISCKAHTHKSKTHPNVLLLRNDDDGADGDGDAGDGERRKKDESAEGKEVVPPITSEVQAGHKVCVRGGLKNIPNIYFFFFPFLFF